MSVDPDVSSISGDGMVQLTAAQVGGRRCRKRGGCVRYRYEITTFEANEVIDLPYDDSDRMQKLILNVSAGSRRGAAS